MTIDYQRATFLLGARRAAQFPPDRGLEVAFAGRSNAGKSSAINLLTGRRGLARVSKQPGRTQEVNFFVLDPARRLVDLPGYGFARAPGHVQRQWGAALERYLGRRRALRGLVVLMDVRHPLTPLDRQLLAWVEPRALPVHLVLTKADKLGRGKALAALRAVERETEPWPQEVSVQLLSVPERQGIGTLSERLDHWLAADEVLVEGG
jgi:GTP-binding protein